MLTKVIQIGRIKIGGGNPVAIQSMLNTDPHDFQKSARQIQQLLQAGCEIIRIAVPDKESLPVLGKLRQRFPKVPLVADIHFSADLALGAIESGVDKIRINPGNFPADKLAEVTKACRRKKIPIRVGVNSGSLEKIRGKNTAEKLANSALQNVRKIEKLGYKNLVVSVKSSDIRTTLAANRILAKKLNYPLHLGVTEAGSLQRGTLKSAVALGSLLADGIGDTIRISLTADPVAEVVAALDLLKMLKLRQGVEVVSCPTCGRTEVDLIPLVEKVEKAVANIKKPLKIAVMGCIVNGPGEARDADFALVGGRKIFAIYAKGRFLKSVPERRAVGEFIKLVAGNSQLVTRN
ncbi:MAG: flavodoxin-dependent (E)-4-hydroxy-3-methylbut-2-enyl-diphosphate synthase [Candidatus Peribacteraceae bacterium]|nr:flavodoxin-dependent (E)-4-hydroxy-3-methylbut-2-enyl-diphosphate synthase [Candidatus Peribacteraceae bacterium]